MLHASIAEPIRQISVSPSGVLIAIVTSHTVHIAALPEPSLLGQNENKTLKLHPKMLARTTHVLSQSPIASVLWHPCGADGSCLVTITADAVVRLWEFNFKDNMSFDEPSLAIDLKKLAVGKTAHQDFTPNRMNANRTYSLDSVGMDVASASFGGNNSSDESPWCAMTLWVAMKDGDVYALCPLLPSNWQPSPTTLPSIAAHVVSYHTSEQDGSLSTRELQLHNDQYEWISELDSQEPFPVRNEYPLLPGAEVYRRPSRPGSVPKLQGPFHLFEDEYEQNLELSDIYVMAAKADSEELMYGEDSDEDSALGLEDESGLSTSIVCLLTRNGRVYICLDVDGTEAEWLPRKRRKSFSPEDEPSLVVHEILEVIQPEKVQATEWPTFSLDTSSRYSVYVTHSQGLFFLSCEPWVRGLERELQSTATAGAFFRMEILTNGPGTLRERILNFEDIQGHLTSSPSAAVVFHDSDLGYFVLTAVNGVPQAVILDQPDSVLEEEVMQDIVPRSSGESSLLALAPARQPYVPSAALWDTSSLPQFANNHVSNRHKKAFKDEIRLSALTLDLMTRAHRVLSEETHTLGVAAADLFRRCERLQDELRVQISRVREIADSASNFADAEDQENIGSEKPKERIEERLEAAQARHAKIVSRFDELSKKLRKCKQPLNDQERAYGAEVAKISDSIIGTGDGDQEDEKDKSKLWNRIGEVGATSAYSIIVYSSTFLGKTSRVRYAH